MKFFVIASLVAAAMAEADPALLLGGAHLGYAGLHGGYGLGYAGHLGYGYAGLKSAPCVNAANVPVPCAAGVVGYAGHYLGKREADAEADPALLYSGLGHTGLGYSGLGYTGLGYSGLGYTGLGHAGHLGYGYAGHTGLGYSGLGYTGLGYTGLGYSGHYLGKREADAEADPALLYSGLGHTGLGYSRLRYTGLGYSGLGLGHGLGYAGTYGYAAPAVTYGVGVLAGHQNGLPHGITTTGVHSSHVGVCTNVHGGVVPC